MMNKAEKEFIETLQNLFGVYRISVHHQADLLKYFKQFKTDFAENEAIEFGGYLTKYLEYPDEMFYLPGEDETYTIQEVYQKHQEDESIHNKI